jgi:chromosome segregation ATPase
LDLFI